VRRVRRKRVRHEERQRPTLAMAKPKEVLCLECNRKTFVATKGKDRGKLVRHGPDRRGNYPCPGSNKVPR
jgi:hypothetical protein